MSKLNQGIAHLIFPCEKVGYEYLGYLDTSYEEIPATYSPSMRLLTPQRTTAPLCTDIVPTYFPPLNYDPPPVMPIALTPITLEDTQNLNPPPADPNPPSLVNLSNPDLLFFLENVPTDCSTL